jgi:NADPH-dependent ferric siderophore reductase
MRVADLRAMMVKIVVTSKNLSKLGSKGAHGERRKCLFLRNKHNVENKILDFDWRMFLKADLIIRLVTHDEKEIMREMASRKFKKAICSCLNLSGLFNFRGLLFWNSPDLIRCSL